LTLIVLAVITSATSLTAFWPAGSPISLLSTLVMFGYVAYFAIDIRHGLAVRAYRNQALGIGLVTIMLAIVFVGPSNSSSNPLLAVLETLRLVLLFVFTFYWIDASVLTARRTDPLLRDTFRWRSVRFVPWFFVILSALLLLVGSLLNQTGGPSVVSPSAVIVTIVVLAGYVGPFILGAILLPISARRSADPQFRKQLVWFGLFLAVFFLIFARVLIPGIYGNNGIYLTLTGFPILAGSAYCLYRSVKALVPLNRISPEDEKRAK